MQAAMEHPPAPPLFDPVDTAATSVAIVTFSFLWMFLYALLCIFPRFNSRTVSHFSPHVIYVESVSDLRPWAGFGYIMHGR